MSSFPRVSEVTADAKSLSALERQGVALACFTLARCLQLGHALDQDQERALQYYTKASLYIYTHTYTYTCMNA